MKVFGIGLSRTGTTSLTDALNLLGIKSVHFPYDSQTLAELSAFQVSGRHALTLSILHRYQGAADTPIALVYRGLDRGYPDSRFILTVRDQPSWLASCERFWSTTVRSAGSNVAWINRSVYGIEHFDRTVFARIYDRHCANVRDYFRTRQRDLLTLNIVEGQGWPELCSFLNLPMPRVAFPHRR